MGATPSADQVPPSPKISNPETNVTRNPIVDVAKANPFILIGAGMTVLALANGLRHMIRRDIYNQQKMMRARVLAQSFTVGMLGVASLYHGYRKGHEGEPHDM